MNGNDESAALLQLSGGSNVDVDEPAAITSTSSSNTVGATTTAGANNSATIPNEDAHISEQQHDTLSELIVFCQSDSLTEEGLFARLSHLEHTHTIDYYYYLYDSLLLAICFNERVTHGMVEFFLRRFPAPGYIAPYGFTPLHALCSNKNATIDIVRCVIEGNPGALVAQDRAGRTPLFYLCANEELDDTMSKKILKFILDTCPESARKRCTQRGLLPIEYAFVDHRSPKFCCLLIEAYPYSDRQEDEAVPTLVRRTVRSLLMSQEVNDRVALAVLELLLHKYSEAMRSMRIGAWSLLHLVARMEIPRAAKICRLVIHALPELVLEHDANGLQPLHLACLGGNSPVVKCILEILPDAIRGVTRSGLFPIHFAVDALCDFPEAAVEMVKTLLAVDPGVASQVHGSLFPLFIACTKTNGSNFGNFWKGLKVIELLYDAYPEAIVTAEQTFRQAIDASEFDGPVQLILADFLEHAAQASDPRLINDYGNIPLHYALLEVAPLGSIKLLVQADLSTLRIPDNEGSLPLHIACKYYCYGDWCPNVVKYLVDLDTMCLRVTNDQGDTPLHCACRAANYDAIELLFSQTYPTAPVATRN
eukprot:scaffold20876_cov71-Skeletonema_dohrnii-CCMP3373.AAC.1